MKIPVRGYLIISAQSPYPSSDNFFIGGVAASAAHEKAGEEDGIVVELTGYYEKRDLEGLLEERIENIQVLLASPPSWYKAPDLAREQASLKYYTECLTKLQNNQVTDLTNLAHFSEAELSQYQISKK